MPGQDAISSHGIVLSHKPNDVGPFVEVGELGDFTAPGLMRNEFDSTPHNRDIDSWVMGVLRRDAPTFPVFFNKGNASHAALRQSVINNTYDGFQLEFPDGDVWIGSGFVRQVTQTGPVDGILAANVTIRLSGPFWLNGVLIGG